MKIAQTLGLILFTCLLISTHDANAQQFREMHPLDIHDFKCLQSLDCAQNSQSLKSKGWIFKFDETVDEFTPELTARMKGENISLIATYDGEGNVIGSRYKRTNIALPNCLLGYLTEGQYDEWNITGSEMVMKDFDPSTIKYKVILESQTSTMYEIYDFEFVTQLHLEHKGLAKHGLF